MREPKALWARESIWLVKGRPDRNTLERSVKKQRTERWVTRRPPRNWLDGDLVVLWEGAPRLKVCAIAELLEVEQRDDHGDVHFTLRYLTPYFGDGPGIEALRREPLIRPASFLKPGAAGTVFPMTRAQAARLLALVEKLAAQTVPARRLGRRTTTKGLALSIRQPWAELILRGIKVAEFRSFATHKRGRVMIYASEGEGPDETRELERRRLKQLPVGKIVGSAEIVGCTRRGPRDYAWALRRPLRLRSPQRPKNHPQPSYFRPF